MLCQARRQFVNRVNSDKQWRNYSLNPYAEDISSTDVCYFDDLKDLEAFSLALYFLQSPSSEYLTFAEG